MCGMYIIQAIWLTLISLSLNLGVVTIRVPEDYKNIQEAVNASNKGDTILIASGTYSELVFVSFKNSHITIKGAGGSVTTPDDLTDDSIIDGTESGRPLTINGHHVTIDGFTIINGRGEHAGGNVDCQGDGCVLKNNLIMKGETESWGGYGGGIYVRASNVRIVDNIIQDNWAWASGGGIYCSSGDNNVITGNTIYDNQADWAGGIYCKSKSILIKNNVIDDNYADFRNGGGILIYAKKTAVIENNTIVNNTAISWGYGGGIYAVTEEHSNLVIINNIITSNINYPAGGIFLSKDESASVQIEYNNVFDNSSADYYECEAGKGSISQDPLFNDKAKRDYRLKASSPCIDAGNPAAQYNDTDGTRNDIGAYGGNQDKPEIIVNRTQMFFGVIKGQAIAPQTFTINTTGTRIQEWTVSSDRGWINCNPSTGSGAGLITVSINETAFWFINDNAEITVSSLFAVNNPQTITVSLTEYGAGSTQAPFGEFSTPIEGSIVRGSIAVTGWGLDDIGIESVQIFKELNGQLVYIGDGVFVEGARPDVELAYPGYPFNYRAGWGYMLLTNFLPNKGNGTYKIYAILTDKEGNTTSLGSKTIVCDNANAVKPFGTLDTPGQGETISGSQFINWGWALTPQPNMIPTDGSTISVYVDGVKLGNPVYNIYRSDIARLFPGYTNTYGAAAYFYLDSTDLDNGVHSIQWAVKDDAGNSDGIGSRYISIMNYGSSISMAKLNRQFTPSQLKEFPVNSWEKVALTTGFVEDEKAQNINPDQDKKYHIEMNQLERIAVKLSQGGTVLAGYLIVGNHLGPLPIGSTLDKKSNIFYWQPGPGFIGRYPFVFVVEDQIGNKTQQHITFSIM